MSERASLRANLRHLLLTFLKFEYAADLTAAVSWFIFLFTFWLLYSDIWSGVMVMGLIVRDERDNQWRLN